MENRPGGNSLEKLIYRGAEADVFLGRWYDVPAVFKIRKPKGYRLPALDQQIRRQRTLREASLVALSRKAGVHTPVVYYVDPERAEIVMQYVEGSRIKDSLSTGNDASSVCFQLGRSIGDLHKNGIIHGDLTTSNFILSSGQIVFVDFGLSFLSNKVEDKAVDLHLIKEVLNSAHRELAPKVFNKILAGYESVVGEDILHQIQLRISTIEQRARYARID